MNAAGRFLVAVAVALGSGLQAPLLCAAEPLVPLPGRLFLTPAERVALERQRQAGPPETRRLAEGLDLVRLDGVVTRSSGKSTVWVNQHAQTDRAAVAGLPADLRVGVTLDRATREITGGLAAGTVRVKRPAVPP
jgi:hypothetical protein